MGSCSLSPSSSAAVLTAAAAYEHRCPSSPDDDDYHEDDGFEFTPLLRRPPRRRRSASARAERPRTVLVQHQVVAAAATTVPQRARRGAVVAAPATAPVPRTKQVRWHDMAFGSVRVPAAMDMGEIRRRLRARQQALAHAGGGAGNTNGPSFTAGAGWAPWRLIRSLSCKGVEAVAAAAAPVRLV